MMVTALKVAATIFAVSSILTIVQAGSLSYDPSMTYTYSYQTDINLNDPTSGRNTRPRQDVGVKLSIVFELSTVYNDDSMQMFKLSIVQAVATSVIRPDVQTDLLVKLSLPTYFQLARADDTVQLLHFLPKDTLFGRNIKKGIIALFQVQEQEGERTEVDVSGECTVKYSIPQAGVIDRIKTDCKNLEIAGQFSNTNKALGVSLYTKSSQQYKLDKGIISSMTGVQRVFSYLNMRASLSGGGESSQNLKFESKAASSGSSVYSSEEEALVAAALEFGSKPTLSLLPSEEETQQCSTGCESPKSLAAKLVEDLKAENVASLKSAKAFTQMLKSFRTSGKKTIAEVFTSPDSYYIVPQLVDVATATQTEASREALLELLNFEDADAVEYPQRFLFAAAYSSHPSESLISDLLSVLKKPIPNDSLRESLLLSLGAIVHTFCQKGEQCGAQVVADFKGLVTSELAKCQDDPCKLMYLRALGNAGLTTTVPTILPFTEVPGSPMVSSTAIGAFRRISNKYITKEVKDALARIFNQNKASYDSSVRLAALEFLLEHQPSTHLIQNVLLACVDQTNAELSSYIIKQLTDAASVSPFLRAQLQSVLQDRTFNNYNIFAQKGKSSVITSFLAKMQDLNSTYNLYFENSQSGVMKRSGMVVNLLGKTIKQSFMKFGIYADGLESLVGEESESSTADDGDNAAPPVEPTAGMSFTFMDVLLTQVEFFRGTSGLMSAVWNAPSELTSALQGNLLLQDHSQRIHLSNGLVLDTQVLGVLSMDLSGFVSISLWNRNCEALIRNSGAYYLEGSLSVESKELSVALTFTGEGESNIDFTSNADFYEMPLKLCMQMMRPDFQFIQKVEKQEKLGKSKRYVARVSTRTQVSGESYFLNKANSDECRVMLKEN